MKELDTLQEKYVHPIRLLNTDLDRSVGPFFVRVSRPKFNLNRSSYTIKMVDLNLHEDDCDQMWWKFIDSCGVRYDIEDTSFILVDILAFFIVEKPAKKNLSRVRNSDVLTTSEDDNISLVSGSGSLSGSTPRKKTKTISVPLNLKIIVHDLVILDNLLPTLTSTTTTMEVDLSIKKIISGVSFL